jgi:peptide/nickel transport system substrate-binding protein
MFAAGCSSPATSTPEAAVATEAAVVTEAPAATEAPVATEAPAATEEPAATEAPAAAPTGKLRIALTTDINSVIPSNAAERQADIAALAFFDTILFPAADGTAKPNLAEKCEPSADYMTYTCTFRKDVVFHNGDPLNADAVIGTVELLRNPEIAYPFPGEDVVTVEKVDDYTVKFNLKAANPKFDYTTLAYTEVFPADYVKNVGWDAFLEKPVGTGAFVFKEWVKGSHLIGTANPNYWQKGYPLVDEIEFKFISEASTRLAALQSGEVDIITRLTEDEANTIKDDPDLKLITYPLDRVYYVAFNNVSTGKDTPIMDVKVRQALNYAVDRQAIVDALFNGQAALSTSLVTPGDIGYVKSDPYAFDPEKAKALLAEAGYADGFEIDMACPDKAYARINEVCESIASYLGEVGVKVNLEFMESGKFWDMEAKKELPPLFVDSWSADGNPINRITGALAKDQSYAAWWDERIQNLIDSINATGNIDEVNQYYADMQKLLQEEPPFIYLYEPYTFEAIRSTVINYAPRSNEHFWVFELGFAK